MCLCHQPFKVINKTCTTVLRDLVMASQVNRLFRTHFLAIAAEDTAELVNLEDEGVAVASLVLARHQLDAVGRAYGWTQPTGHALGLAGFRGEHPVSAAPARRDLPLLLRILHGNLVRIHH